MFMFYNFEILIEAISFLHPLEQNARIQIN